MKMKRIINKKDKLQKAMHTKYLNNPRLRLIYLAIFSNSKKLELVNKSFLPTYFYAIIFM